jgi:hypothetical protein
MTVVAWDLYMCVVSEATFRIENCKCYVNEFIR